MRDSPSTPPFRALRAIAGDAQAPYLRLPPGLLGRLATTSIPLALMGLLVWATVSRGAWDLRHVVPESMGVETAQPWLWALGAALCAAMCLRSAQRRDMLIACWLALLCALAGARELDLHVLLNPENIRLLGAERSDGVRYRLDWWVSADTSLALRGAWGVILFALGAAIIAPFALARIPWFALLRVRDRAVLLLAGGALLVAGGYVIDDIVARVITLEVFRLRWLEEGSELTGQVVILMGFVLLLLRGPSERAAPSPSEARAG